MDSSDEESEDNSKINRQISSKSLHECTQAQPQSSSMTSNHSYDHDTTPGQCQSRPSTSESPVTREQDSRNGNQIFGDGQMGTEDCAKLKPPPVKSSDQKYHDEEEDSEEEEEKDSEEEEEEDSEEEEEEDSEEEEEQEQEQNLISILLNEGVGANFNRVYNIYCLNEELIPSCVKKKYEDIKSPINSVLKNYRFCIDPNAFNRPNWKLTCKAELNKSCYIVTLSSGANISKTEQFISQITGKKVRKKLDKNSAMIIIPVSQSRALVYTIGRAHSSIMNKHAIIKQWGLKLAASEEISSAYIKQVQAVRHGTDKQKTTTTKTSLPGNIGEFSPVPGADRFYHLRLKRKHSKAFIGGSTKFEFHLRKTYDYPQVQRDLKTLIQISRELHKIFETHNIRRDYAQYIRDEVKEELGQKLNEELVNMLSDGRTMGPNAAKIYAITNYSKYFCDLDLEFLDEEKKEKAMSDFHCDIRSGFLDALCDTMHKVGANLESYVDFNHAEAEIKIEKEPVCSLLVVSAFPYKGKWYRYLTGKWYEIPANRFSDIREAIKDNEIKYDKLGLICYTQEHVNKRRKTNAGEDPEKGQQELNYNIDAASKLGDRKSAIRGIVCDRVLVRSRTPKGFTFELADIFTTNTSETELKESNCLIHVKRKDVKDLAKQCFQMIRAKTYMNSMPDSEKLKHIKETMLRGCFTTLYAKRELQMPKDYSEFRVAQLTHSVKPIKKKPSFEETNYQTEENIMKIVEEYCIKSLKKGFPKFMEEMSKAARTFVKDYELNIRDVELFEISIGALFDCDDKGKPLTIEEAANFCDLVQHFYGVAEELSGEKSTLKTLYFVLAIINDTMSSMCPDLNGSYAHSFTEQDLLALENVKLSVESAGYKFLWTVIEKNFSIERKKRKKKNSPAGPSKEVKNC